MTREEILSEHTAIEQQSIRSSWLLALPERKDVGTLRLHSAPVFGVMIVQGQTALALRGPLARCTANSAI